MEQDTFRHKGMRRQLVEAIERNGIKNKDVLQAINKIPRHLFMDSSFLEFAYEDKPFPIGAGQTISQPYTVAFQTELLEIEKGDKVLEVGTGSGYQACVLIEMGAKVYTIERQRSLFMKTKELLARLNYHPKKMIYGDGYKGLPTYAPFDKVIVTAGAPYVPDALLDQLKTGGMLVIPVGVDTQVMKRIIKMGKGDFKEEEHGLFQFVPLLGDKANGLK
ncbi:MAG: protein-L-isoaspartate(D-aspartate) O-methyltransferase [Chlorobi bacterium]|nr:protein-L-isoaspartate(D-aspartate) O-methyltransferase [Chlorobiota bacterium]